MYKKQIIYTNQSVRQYTIFKEIVHEANHLQKPIAFLQAISSYNVS
jgi:hypothetical protein